MSIMIGEGRGENVGKEEWSGKGGGKDKRGGQRGNGNGKVRSQIGTKTPKQSSTVP